MGKCAFCGEEDYLLFTCSICGKTFCSKHRIPETHGCSKVAHKVYAQYSKEAYKNIKQPLIKKENKSASTFIIVLIIIVGLSSIIYLQYKPTSTDIQQYVGNISTSIIENIETINKQINETQQQVQDTLSDALPKPPTQDELVQYALIEINRERTKQGLQNVTLSPITCGQSHAVSLLELKCLSHWDAKGLKPYMRYTLADGKGAVAENCAWMRSTGKIDPYEAIKKLNWNMIYDDADSNWGHRDNLLNPSHNRVSIGVAYDGYNLFLIQDFEDYYFELAEITQVGTRMDMRFIATLNWEPSQVAIYYDPLPSDLSVEVLRKQPYDSGYDMGSYIGAVVPSGWRMQEGLTINAVSWSHSTQSFQVSFNMSKAFNQYGYGVYTFLIWSSNQFYTTYSIWYDG